MFSHYILYIQEIMASTKVLSEANAAWRMLNGIVCLYKPLGYSRRRIIIELQKKLSDDLNQMQRPPRQERVELIRLDANEKASRVPMENENVILSIQDGEKSVEVVKGLGYSDHPLVSGPQFNFKDLKILPIGKTGQDDSGVHVCGINKGVFTAQNIIHNRWLKTFLVSGRFGIGTDTYFHTGRILQKTTYGRIRRPLFERFLATSEAAHQRYSFLSSGAPLQSERAYELASQGLVRPDKSTDSIIYSMKCVDFNLPDFTIEIKSINSDPDYFKELIHHFGLKLKSTATCTKIQCTNFGPFGIQEALLFKHWNLENILQNMNLTQGMLKQFELKQRSSLIGKPLTKVLDPEVYEDNEEDSPLEESNEPGRLF